MSCTLATSFFCNCNRCLGFDDACEAVSNETTPIRSESVSTASSSTTQQQHVEEEDSDAIIFEQPLQQLFPLVASTNAFDTFVSIVAEEAQREKDIRVALRNFKQQQRQQQQEQQHQHASATFRDVVARGVRAASFNNAPRNIVTFSLSAKFAFYVRNNKSLMRRRRRWWLGCKGGFEHKLFFATRRSARRMRLAKLLQKSRRVSKWWKRPSYLWKNQRGPARPPAFGLSYELNAQLGGFEKRDDRAECKITREMKHDDKNRKLLKRFRSESDKRCSFCASGGKRKLPAIRGGFEHTGMRRWR